MSLEKVEPELTSSSTPAHPKHVAAVERKKYVALKSMKITCNSEFQLVEGKEIPQGIDKAFIQSLISSNLIK